MSSVRNEHVSPERTLSLPPVAPPAAEPDEQGPREECGVFGVWAPGEDVAKMPDYGLYALQHRGQEAAGIAVRLIRGEPGTRSVRVRHRYVDRGSVQPPRDQDQRAQD